MVLERHPDGNVVVTPSSNNGDVDVSPASLNFNSNNWDTSQVVTVSAAHDDDAINDSATITHALGGFVNVTADPVSVTVNDDDRESVNLSVSALTVDEGGSETYTVVLESNPNGNVVVAPSSNNGDVVDVSPASLSFNANNWDDPQTVTVSAAHDDDAIDGTATVAHAVTGYGNVTDGGTVSVTVIDDDPVVEPAVHLSVSALTIDEGGSGAYTVVLESNPDGLVTVTPSSDSADVTVSSTSLTFTANSWDDPQTVTVSTAHDDDTIDDTATVAHAVTGYGNVTDGGTVSVTVIDDDPVVEPGVHLSVSALTIEEGGSGTYAVVLESNPDSNVIVIPSSNSADVTVSPASLTFTANDWSTPQPVTVSAAHDQDAIVESAAITHSVSGYGSVNDAGTVSVTVNEVSPPVSPPVEEVERVAVTDTLATVAATTVSNVTTNIGARFSAARGGTSVTSLSLAGQSATQPIAFEEMGLNSLWESGKPLSSA